MSKKKLEVVGINKKETNIIIKEDLTLAAKKRKKFYKLLTIVIGIISVAVLITGIIISISNLSKSEKLIIKEVSIDTDLTIGSADVTSGSLVTLTEETAKKIFNSGGTFKKTGEVFLVKTVSKGKYKIKFYSDYTAIKFDKNSNLVTKINPVNGDYGIKENGITNRKAETIDIVKKEEKTYPWGTVIYYSDGSAEVISQHKKIDMYVRNAADITDNYISDNKISYLKDTVNHKGTKLNYYYDGTIEVIKNGKSYLVRDAEDLDITDNNVTFKNENEATIINTIKLADGKKIDYYSDGGAIITDGNKSVSIRKSNSIIIKDNKLFEIGDNKYVTISKTSKDGNVTYYTNGSAVINNYNGEKIYVKESSDIKYKDNIITSIGDNYEKLSNESNIGTDKVSKFETISVIQTDKYIAIVPKDNILYDSDGSVKTIITDKDDNNTKPIKITNNTNEKIKYRLVIESSNRTTLDTEYIRYQLTYGPTYVGPKKLNENIWKQDKISDSLSVQGTNYILLERTLEPTETDEIRLMLWTDYDTIPNSMQNTYFYGTIRIYAWQEIEANI